MPRFFNTAGPCNPRDHYMLPPEKRLPKVRTLIERGQYFVVHAPRQSGKTTLFRTLAPDLTASGRYAALLASCEVAQAAGGNVERGIAALLDALRQAALIHLPEELRPPVVDPSVPAETRLLDLLSRWARHCPRRVVLFLDEIDSLLDDILVSVLRQLRSGYPERPEGSPHSVALIGLRRHPEERPPRFFNIAVESLTLPNFSAAEITELYQQHTWETGQSFTPEAERLVFELTGGHPWLVNALAERALHGMVADSRAGIEVAKETLLQDRKTCFASLIALVNEPRVRRVIEPIFTGKTFSKDVLGEDIQRALDLGLVRTSSQGLTIANPIYREVISSMLTPARETSLALLP